jgi:manganese oxidase
VWSNNRLPYAQSGQWGYLRVLPAGDSRIQPLGTQGTGAKRAETELQPQAMPTAMK